MKTRKRNHLKNLLPDWQKPIKRMRELGVRSPMIVSFAAYCAHQGIAFTKATDAHLADYIASKVLAGAITERSAEQYRISIVASLRGLKELDPDAPATLISTDSTYALRQKQFEELPQALKAEFEFLAVKKWSSIEEKVVRTRRNMLLRHIELLEDNGFPVASLVDLATLPAFDQLTALNFGAKADRLPDSQSSFLTVAVDIASAWQRADLVQDLRSKMKTVKTPGGIAAEPLAKIFAFDDLKMHQLMVHATTTLASADDPRSSLTELQAAFGVVLIGVTAQPVRVIRKAQFTNGLEKQNDPVALTTISLGDRKFPMPANLQAAIGMLRVRLAGVTKSSLVFVKADGTLKGTSAITISVNELSKAAGARTDPQSLGGAVVLSLLERGVPWRKVCQHLGWSQEINFYRRFRPLIEYVGQSYYADNAGGNS